MTLFATAYPLCAFLAFVNNVLEIRIDAQKLVGAPASTTGAGLGYLIATAGGMVGALLFGVVGAIVGVTYPS